MPEPPPSFSVLPLKPPTDLVMTTFIIALLVSLPSPPAITSPAFIAIKYSLTLYTSHTTLIHSSLLLSSNVTMKLLFPTLLLLFLLLHSCFSQSTTDRAGFCGSKCSKRCSKASVMDRCTKYCGICCQECECVPSGTYGNKHECPCYRDKKNSKGKPKCP